MNKQYLIAKLKRCMSDIKADMKANLTHSAIYVAMSTIEDIIEELENEYS